MFPISMTNSGCYISSVRQLHLKVKKLETTLKKLLLAPTPVIMTSIDPDQPNVEDLYAAMQQLQMEFLEVKT